MEMDKSNCTIMGASTKNNWLDSQLSLIVQIKLIKCWPLRVIKFN
jgi:hypothetical protein